MLALDIAAATGRAYVAHLKKYLPRAHALLKPALVEMSLALVGDRRMAALHERFMGIAGPTDVLTFELDHDARGRVTAGEVVVCVSHALREARRRRGVAPRDEVLLYALHGMLHLCGYDDRTDRDFAKMHRREDQILNALGVGAVYSTGAGNRASGTRLASEPAKRGRGGAKR
jgi:probable rRNA maturation factor